MWTRRDVEALRRRLGMNRGQFARLLGVDSRTVFRWESSDGPNPRGSAEAVMTAIREKLDADPRAAKKVVKFLGGAAAVGGLAYVLLKLLGKLGAESKEES